MAEVSFTKMHGLGNDFVVLDARESGVCLTPAQIRALGDRHRGIGFDQIMVLRDSETADVRVDMANADGETVGACGNGARCVAGLLMTQTGRDSLTMETGSGPISARRTGTDTAVDMGPARLSWDEIPLAREMDTLHLPVAIDTAAGRLDDPVGVNMGNPHAVFFVDDPSRYPLESFGASLENDPLFPEKANISLAAVRGDGIKLRVWERGVGLTLACGTAACAVLVAASRRDLCGRQARVDLPGGSLDVAWRDDGHVVMTGPTAVSFTGIVDPDRLV